MRKASLSIIFFTVFLDLVGFGIVIPLLPRYAETFAATPLEIGLLLAVYSFMQFVFNPLWGRLSDRVGRRPVLLCSLAGFVVSYAMLGWAPTLGWLFASRILAGISGANIAAAQAYIADITPPEKRAQGMGLIGVAFGLGFTVGPALSALLVGGDKLHPNYPLIGYGAGGMSLAALLLALFLLPESLDRNVPLPKRPRLTWNNLVTALSRPGLSPLFLVFFVASFAFANMESTFTLFLEHRFGLDARDSGYFFVLIGLIVAAMQGGMVRVLVPKFGEVRVLRSGLLVMTAGMLGLALTGSVPFTAAAIGLVAMGNGLLGPAAFSALSRAARVDEQGGVLGIAQGLAALGRVFGPIVGNLLFFGKPEGSGFLGYFAVRAGVPQHISAPYYAAAGFMGMAWIVALIGIKRAE